MGIGCLIVFSRVCDGLIILRRTAVYTPSCIEVDNGFTAPAAFGGDDDDTGGSTRSVQGGGSSVLKDGDRLNVALRNVGQGCGICGADNDDKRLC